MRDNRRHPHSRTLGKWTALLVPREGPAAADSRGLPVRRRLSHRLQARDVLKLTNLLDGRKATIAPDKVRERVDGVRPEKLLPSHARWSSSWGFRLTHGGPPRIREHGVGSSHPHFLFRLSLTVCFSFLFCTPFVLFSMKERKKEGSRKTRKQSRVREAS